MSDKINIDTLMDVITEHRNNGTTLHVKKTDNNGTAMLGYYLSPSGTIMFTVTHNHCQNKAFTSIYNALDFYNSID
jgi:hypothetical protein